MQEEAGTVSITPIGWIVHREKQYQTWERFLKDSHTTQGIQSMEGDLSLRVEH